MKNFPEKFKIKKSVTTLILGYTKGNIAYTKETKV